MKQPDLARTRRLITEGGEEVFYRSKLAQCIVHYAEAHRGLLNRADLATREYYEGRRVQMENRFPTVTRDALQVVGHQVELIGAQSWTIGGGQSIQRDAESADLGCGHTSKRLCNGVLND